MYLRGDKKAQIYHETLYFLLINSLKSQGQHEKETTIEHTMKCKPDMSIRD